MGLVGVWLGPAIAQVFLAICYHTVIQSIDWKQLILEARARSKNEDEIRKGLKKEESKGEDTMKEPSDDEFIVNGDEERYLLSEEEKGIPQCADN